MRSPGTTTSRRRDLDGAGLNKKVRLSDVAKLAGVSTMTVSKVIRKTGSISAPTRERVNEAIDELGYLPNLIAVSLSSQTNLLVGVIIPNLGSRVFDESLRGINTVLTEAGMHTLIGTSDNHTDREEELIKTMLPWQPSGIILTGGIAHSATTNKLLSGRPCPIIQIWDNDVPEFEVNVGFSHIEAGRVIARHLYEKGYRKIAYIGAQHDKDVCAARRYQGFCEQLAEFDLGVVSEISVKGERETSDGVRGTQKLLERSPDIDAICYLNDAMAVGGLTHMYRVGIKTPEQIAVAGFNGSSIGQLISTELTTIDIPRWDIGETAARLLLDRISGKDTVDRVDVELRLVPGSTT